MARNFSEVLDAYIDQEKLYRIEGRRGVETICQIAGALGYKDPMYFGQLSSKAKLGDLICMLGDNPGMIEAMIEWLKDTGEHVPEWKQELEAQVGEEEKEETV